MDFFVAKANMNVRVAPDGSSDAISDVPKGQVIKVLESNGDWCRISLRGRDDVWLKSRTKVKSLLDAIDPSTGAEKWEKQQGSGPGLANDESEKEKQDKEKKVADEKAAAEAKSQAAATPAAATPAAAATAAAAPAASVAVAGEFYTTKVSSRVRTSPNPDADVIADLGRSMVCKVVEEQGDWVRIERPDAQGNATPAWRPATLLHL